jgi:chromosome segregation ATPase
MRTTVMCLTGALVVGAAALSGHAQRQPATLDEVVNELRALRAELRQTSGGSVRMQLLIARLSAQEQRIGILVNQRANITPRLLEVARQRADVEYQVKRLDDMNTRQIPSEVPPADLQPMLENFKNTLARFRDAERELRAQDDQLAAQIASEQSRWLDFNSRLDALERELK